MDEEFPDFRSIVLGDSQFKCAGRECNRFFGCFGHYVGAGLGCFSFRWFVSLFDGSFLFCDAFVYSLYALGLVPFFSNIYLLPIKKKITNISIISFAAKGVKNIKNPA